MSTEISAGLLADESPGVIALEIKPISFRHSPAPLSSPEISREVSDIPAYHGYDKVVIEVHSYGSAIGTPPLVNSH